jgi:uncharacterized protein (TIGR00251 family)
MKGVDKLRIHDVAGGVVIAVKAVPASSRDRIVGVLGDCLKITTSSPAEKGKANAAIAHILAVSLGVDPHATSLAAGATRSRKELLIKGMTAAQVRSRLEQLA